MIKRRSQNFCQKIINDYVFKQEKDRLILFCSFIGRQYHGFQTMIVKGEEIDTVQRDLEYILTRVFKQDTKVLTCSRTDAEVSAKNLAVQIKIHNFKKIPLDQLQSRLNFQFQCNRIKISINDIFYAHPELDVRTSVLFKEYEYRMDINLQKNIFDAFQREKLVWSLDQSINVDKFKEALDLYIGTHNFIYFTVNQQAYDLDDYKREIQEIQLIQMPHECFNEAQQLIIKIKAKKFMTYQIRYMIGLAYLYSIDQCDLDYFKEQLNPHCIDFQKFQKNNKRFKAPALGLTLNKVIYPEYMLSKNYTIAE